MRLCIPISRDVGNRAHQIVGIADTRHALARNHIADLPRGRR